VVFRVTVSRAAEARTTQSRRAADRIVERRIWPSSSRSGAGAITIGTSTDGREDPTTLGGGAADRVGGAASRRLPATKVSYDHVRFS
jgi:hypothetical protein